MGFKMSSDVLVNEDAVDVSKYEVDLPEDINEVNKIG
jgi:hypothetical protein